MTHHEHRGEMEQAEQQLSIHRRAAWQPVTLRPVSGSNPQHLKLTLTEHQLVPGGR